MMRTGKNIMRRRVMAVLLCMGLVFQTFGPVRVYAAGAEGQSAVQADAPVQETSAADPLGSAGQGDYDASAPGDPDRATPGSQDAENYFSPEELEEAQEFYEIDKEEEPEPTPEEIKAEQEEKARFEEEVHSNWVDDSDKLAPAAPEEGAEQSSDDLEGVGFWPFTSESEVTLKIGSKTEKGKINDLVKRSISQKQPIYLFGDLAIPKTIEVPEGSTVTIYLCGWTLKASGDLGRNELISVEKRGTLRLYGSLDSTPTKQYLNNNALSGGRDGAIIAKDQSTVILTDLIVKGNSARRNGGGIYLGEKVRCDLNNVHITGNEAGNCGGGIYVAGKQTNISFDSDTKITDNKASDGAAIYVNRSKVNLYGPSHGKVLVKGNVASGSGGAFYLNDSDISGDGFEIRQNRANKYGGGVMMESTGTMLTECDIVGNTAEKDGGGVYINGKVGSLSNVTVEGNRCGMSYNGGGIYVDSMDNVSTGGRFFVYNNYRGKDVNPADNLRSDLYLQNGKVTDAYIHAANYAPGSKIGVGVTDWKEGQRITFSPGTFNPRFFVVNNGLATRDNNKSTKGKTFYVASDGDPKSSTYRHLVLVTKAETALTPGKKALSGRNNEKAKTTQADLTYTTSSGDSYPVYYGYASSPSHTDEEKDIVNKYFYSDGYFMGDPKVYDPHLATFGMNLAMASADSNVEGHSDYAFKFENVKNVLQGIGCAEKDIWISPSYIVKPTDSSIGVAIGHKYITDKSTGARYTLVPIAVRSYGYEKEWASNMTIDGKNTSDGEETSGFRDARTKVMEAIKNYIDDYGLEADLSQGRVKFFITGFSRGSATANLTSKALVDTYGELSDKYKAKPNQIYGYCFAVPAGGTDKNDLSLTKNKAAYYCIHNIINKVDLTPMVAPKEMGFKRYGVDHYVPGNDASTVRTAIDQASKANNGYKITMFYDNDAWYTDSSAYSAKRPAMLKQLMYVNDEIHFVDWFKETDMDITISAAIGRAIKGWFTETPMIQSNEVKNSKKTIEKWLPEFYHTVQDYYTVGASEKLTRKSYSNTVVRSGISDKSKLGSKKNWYSKGSTGQDAFRGLVMMMLSKTPTEKANLGQAFSGVKNKLGIMEMAKIFNQLINSKKGWDESQEIQQNYLDLFWNKLNDDSHGQKALKSAITDPSEYADFENYYSTVLALAMRIVRQDYNDKDHQDHLRLLGTFGANTEAILQGHVPEIALAWLRAYDSYYNAESVSYYWAKEDIAPSTPDCYIGENKASATQEVKGDQKLTLRAGKGDAIFYTVSDGSAGNPVPLLYNDSRGVSLKAPKSGTVSYTVKTWSRNSYVKEDRQVNWKKSADAEFRFTVKPAVSDELYALKYHYMIYKPGTTPSWIKGAPEPLSAGINCRQGQEITLNAEDYRKTFEKDGEYFFVGWGYGNECGPEYRKTLTLKAPEKEKNYSVSTTASRGNYEFVPTVFVYPKTDLVKVVTGYDLSKLKAGDEFPGLLYSSIDFLNEKSGDSPVSHDSGPAIAWKVKNAAGNFVPVQGKQAEGGKTYRAYVTLDADKNSHRIFKDKVKLTVDGGQSKEYVTDSKGSITFYLEHTTPIEEVVKTCSAGDHGETAVTISNTGTAEQKKARIRASLPAKVGFLETKSGKSVNGCYVNWDFDGIKDSDVNKTGSFDIYGKIDITKSDAARQFSGYKWDEWYVSSGFSEPFRVKATVTVTEGEKLQAPLPDLDDGTYMVYPGDYTPEDVSEYERDEDGNVLVSLLDPNGMSGEDEYGFIYLVTTDPSKTGDESLFEQYDGEQIVLEKPENENETVVYYLAAKAKVVTGTEANSSEIAVYTYTLTRPALRTVRAFIDDHDYPETDPEVMEEMDTAYEAKAETGDELLVDYDSLTGADSDQFDFVSWNEVILPADEGDPAEIKPLSDEATLWYEVGDRDVFLQALTAPVLKEVSIDLEAPETGEALQDHPGSVKMKLGRETYDVFEDSVSVSWSSSDEKLSSNIARSYTTYDAMITISGNMLECIEDDTVFDGPRFLTSPDEDPDITVNGIVNNSLTFDQEQEDKEVTSVGCWEELDENGLVEKLIIYVRFKETKGPNFISVEPPEGLSISFNALTYTDRYEKDVKKNLPSQACVTVDDGSVQALPVSWVEDGEVTITDIDDHGEEVEKTIRNVVAFEYLGYSDTAYDDDDVYGYPLQKEDLNGLDEINLVMEGYVTLPDDMGFYTDEKGEPLNEDIEKVGDEYRCYFAYPVFLAGSPVSAMPEILPADGDYDPTDEEIILDFNTFPLEPGNATKVYYLVTYHNEEEEASDDGEGEEDYDFDLDLPCWYDENGEFVADERARIFDPDKVYDLSTDAGIEEHEKDVSDRTIRRETLESMGADTVKVTAVAVEEGAYRMSAASDTYYHFTDKPVADISDETLEELMGLKLESGKSLSTLTLPENCSFDESVDLYKVREGQEGEYIDTIVVYNDDPANYDDLFLDIRIEITAGTYSILTEGCTAYRFDGETASVNALGKITEAKEGSRVYVRADEAPDEYRDSDTAEIAGWILVDEEGEEPEYYIDPDNDDSIDFEMPRSAVFVSPLWYDPGQAEETAAVDSLTLDKTLLELKKNEEAVIKATAVYSEWDDEAYKTPVTFRSGDTSVAEVTFDQKGKATVKAVGSGKTVIWAVCRDKTASCVVNVGEYYVNLQLTDCKAYDITDGTATLLEDTAVKGRTIRLEADEQANPAYVFKEWTVNGPAFDRTKNPVTFKLTTDLVAKAEFEVAEEYEDPGEYPHSDKNVKGLIVTDMKNRKIKAVDIALDETISVNAVAAYERGADKPPIVFRSSNVDVARVTTRTTGEGKAMATIVGCKPGSSVITAYCGDEKVSFTVTVAEEVSEGYSLIGDRLQENATDDGQFLLELNTGEQELLSVVPDPFDNLAEMKVKWKVDDSKVATVKDGLVTAKMADKGHTTITVNVKTRPAGTKKWVDLEPVKIVVRVRKIAVPKKLRKDKSYSISLKSSQKLDLTAERLEKPTVVSECYVTAKIKGTPKGLVWNSTNENIVEIVEDSVSQDGSTVKIRSKAPGTAYITLTGTDPENEEPVNRAVMKVVVKATAPELDFTGDALGLLEINGDETAGLTLKQGSCDRLFYSIRSADIEEIATEKITMKGSGGVTVRNGLIYAKSVSKNGKPGKVVLKCGRSKIELPVTVE